MAAVRTEIEEARELLQGKSPHFGELSRGDQKKERAYGRARMAAILERYSRRMHSLSEFMRALLQRYTRWFNKRHGLRGTLWEDRFHSVIVQGGLAARTMAAYIDLNPVRSAQWRMPRRFRPKRIPEPFLRMKCHSCQANNASLFTRPKKILAERKGILFSSRKQIPSEHMTQRTNDLRIGLKHVLLCFFSLLTSCDEGSGKAVERANRLITEEILIHQETMKVVQRPEFRFLDVESEDEDQDADLRKGLERCREIESELKKLEPELRKIDLEKAERLVENTDALFEVLAKRAEAFERFREEASKSAPMID